MRINYLTAVNKVLTRMRENTAITVDENNYSALIGEFVNDAKEHVENAWDWSSLRDTAIINTIAGEYQYTLVGLDERATMVDSLNVTTKSFLRFQGTHWFQRQLALADPDAVGPPQYFGPNSLDSSGWSIVDVFPVPDGVYQLNFNVIYRREPLAKDTDILYLPSKPVILRAFAKALSERGEQGGQSALEAFAEAEQVLADAIALDAYRHPEELMYRVP